MPKNKLNPAVGTGIVLVGNLLLLIAVGRFDVFAGPSTPDVVGQIALGFLGTNFFIVTWMLVFGLTGFRWTSMIGGGAGFMAMFFVLLFLS